MKLKYTVGLMAMHKTFKAPMLVKVLAEIADESVRLIVESGRGGRMNSFGELVISRDNWDNRPFDPADSIVEARWAFGLFDLSF